MKVGILGGGLTGLTLGYLLHKKGVDFEILEKENECGGLMRTLQKDGFTFDYGGSHIIFSKNKELLDFMLKLLGDNNAKNTRNTKILYKNRYIKYPFENGLADLPTEDNFECLYYFIQNLIDKEKNRFTKPQNLKEWFYYTFGEGIAEKYLIPYNEKIWNFPLDSMSTEWVERIPNPPVEDIIKSSIGIITEGYTHQLHFYYPKFGGIQSLISSLKKEIKNHVSINFEVKKLSKAKNSWQVSDGIEKKNFDKIISTIPIQSLVTILNTPYEIKEKAFDLKYNSLITVMLGLDTPEINNISWLYIPDKSVLTHRVSFPSNYSPYVTPDNNSSILAEITCSYRDQIWSMSDKNIIERVIKDLEWLNIIESKDICFTDIAKFKYAYVINHLNYSKNIATINKYMQRIGIELVGRFSEFEYLNMDDCIIHANETIKKWRNGI